MAASNSQTRPKMQAKQAERGFSSFLFLVLCTRLHKRLPCSFLTRCRSEKCNFHFPFLLSLHFRPCLWCKMKPVQSWFRMRRVQCKLEWFNQLLTTKILSLMVELPGQTMQQALSIEKYGSRCENVTSTLQKKPKQEVSQIAAMSYEINRGRKDGKKAPK